MPRVAEVKCNATIGEAVANRDAGIKAAQADEMRMGAKYANDIEVAKSQRDFELKKAAFDKEVNTRVKKLLCSLIHMQYCVLLI